MRFFTPEWNVKRKAKRLKKALNKYGQEASYTRCLDLMARMYGFAHFSEMKHAVVDCDLSPFDEYVDDQTPEVRFLQQERVMADAGFADVAGAVLDEVNPTDRQCLAIFDESELAADA